MFLSTGLEKSEMPQFRISFFKMPESSEEDPPKYGDLFSKYSSCFLSVSPNTEVKLS